MRRVPKKVVFGVAAVVGLFVVLVAEPRIALVAGVGLMAAALLWLAVAVRGLSRTLAREGAQNEQRAKKQRAGGKAAAWARNKQGDRDALSERAVRAEREERRELKRLQLLLWHGNMRAGVEAVREF